jgi:hypothetical protein
MRNEIDKPLSHKSYDQPVTDLANFVMRKAERLHMQLIGIDGIISGHGEGDAEKKEPPSPCGITNILACALHRLDEVEERVKRIKNNLEECPKKEMPEPERMKPAHGAYRPLDQ